MKKFFLTVLLCTAILSYGKQQIVFWHVFAEPLRGGLEKLVAEYNASQKETEIKLLSVDGYDELFKKIKGLFIYKAALPDIFLGYSSWLSQIPVDRLMVCGDILSKDISGRMNEQLLIDAQYAGKQYGLPFNKSILMMYANEDILKKAGIDLGTARAEDLYSILEQIRKKTGKTPLAYNGGVWFFQNMLANMGGRDPCDFKSEAGVKVLDWIRTGFKKKLIYIRSGFSFQDLWTSQEAAIVFSSIVSLQYMKDKISFSYKRYNFLKSDDGITRSVLAGSNLYVSKDAAKIKYISDFVNWLYSKGKLEEWIYANDYLPLSPEDKGGDIYKDLNLLSEPNDDNWFILRQKYSNVIKSSIATGESSKALLDAID